MRRPRGPGGRFLTAKEVEDMRRAQAQGGQAPASDTDKTKDAKKAKK